MLNDGEVNNDLLHMIQNPPKSFLDADCQIINHGRVFKYCLRWYYQRDAVEADYETIPELDPVVWIASGAKDLGTVFYGDNPHLKSKNFDIETLK